ncbi:hypothetical protein F0P96_06115 [Hymenobacter busanensis]|uniref:Uncharacterized protein n=1 Tax=Hymenobacter busanensis TaxID=2607656 RepID=A0A7L5A2B7_9BACT|nr:hypothetical protein [Hymenobacter busanensis]KAA9338408.1 hypothetical protein F0P96_06115 [Hymenobacter busanensis]QHJ09165.1 hypothetical protein GUY19_18490 [Hymenobacter busanensis]
MKSFALAALLAVAAPGAASAQTKPAAASPTSLEARVGQYYTDLTQRLREIYYAPSDGRAIAFISSTTQEMGARRKALRAELAQRPASAKATNPAASPLASVATQRQAIEELNSSPAAAKFTERFGRNPALELAYKRLIEANLAELNPAPPRP